MNKIVSRLLVFFMVLTFVAPIQVYADDTNVDISVYKQHDTYSYFVSATSGKVVRVGDNNSLLVDVEEQDGNDLHDKSLFKVEQNTDGTRVQIIRADTGKVWSSNGTSLTANSTKIANPGTGSWEGFSIETDAGTNISKIKNYSGKYIVLNGDQMAIGTTDGSTAAKFYLVDPLFSDSSVYIEHIASGKYIKANGTNGDSLLVNGEVTEGGIIGDNLRYTPMYGDSSETQIINFVSKAYPNLAWKSGGKEEVYQNTDIKASGWESILIVPNGDGTISFKDAQNKSYITVTNSQTMKRGYKGDLTDNEKFVIHSVVRPKKVTDVKASQIGDTTMIISWLGVSNTIYTGYVIIATPPIGSGKETITSPEMVGTSFKLEGLVAGTAYDIVVRTNNANGTFGESKSLAVQTKNGPCPAEVVTMHSQESNSHIEITWDGVDMATSYQIYRARSAFDKDGYTLIAKDITTTSYVDTSSNPQKYNNYYKVVAVNENGESEMPDGYTSLETEKFGNTMIFFAETDDVLKIDEVVADVFARQNDYANDAQFNENRYALYFKPGDYTKTKIMALGFYTHIGGLGKTPYDVKLNNIEIPSYLSGDNATCNFWRSTENISIIATGDNSSKFGSYRGGQFNWAVAQAAPLRRIYSERAISYDWNYGWASGGYTADSLITGRDGEGNSAGTHSGQQFFTRNSVITGNGYGTTLNNFFLGVTAPNLPSKTTGDALVNDNGYSNWGIPTDKNAQQVATNISTTPRIREKPFLFLDEDGEYKVFVPSLQKDKAGTSWSNNDIGEGKIVSIEEFYIAKEKDTASTINAQLKTGKHIFFTPGIYYAEEVITVNNPNTIVLGTGMASIIPDNEDTAMRVGDKEGITIAGLIFDAGTHSKYLLQVGVKGEHNSHEDNPTLLADLFFRVGGTTSELTKADDALEINSDDVIGDHFWIWRADHGAGVAWDGNESKHGLIVTGNNVTCYALFNEHFQEYNTLWEGENGATYFYQNETPYDPISQEAWMNHKGTTNGYSAYKVANKVNTHYAVGIGIYNCFIYTGPSYDAMEVQIQLDNAIEVPNKPGVLIENACVQTFAKAEGALQKINHIINDCGEGVSSGKDKETGEIGGGWDRQFILSYQNGICIRGFNKEIIENGIQMMNDAGDVDLTVLQTLYDSIVGPQTLLGIKNYINLGNTFKINELDYTATSWNKLLEVLEETRILLEEKGEDWATQEEVDIATTNLRGAIKQLTSTCDVTNLNNLYNMYKDTDISKYSQDKQEAFKAALATAKQILLTRDVDQDTVDKAYQALEKAIANLKDVGGEEEDKKTDNGDNPSGKPTITNTDTNNRGINKSVKTGDDTQMTLFGIVSILALTTFLVLKKKKEI